MEIKNNEKINITPEEINILKKSLNILDKMGLYAKKELLAYLETGLIPRNVLDSINKVLKVDFAPGKQIKTSINFTDKDVVDLSAAIYASKVLEVSHNSENPDSVVGVKAYERKIVTAAIKGLDNYLLALHIRQQKTEKILANGYIKVKDKKTNKYKNVPLTTKQVEDLKKDLRKMASAFKTAIQVKAQLSTMNSKHSIALDSALEFLRNHDMETLLEYFSRIPNIELGKTRSTEIINGDTTETYNAIKKLLEKQKKANEPVMTKKPVVENPGDQIVEVEGGDDGDSGVINDDKKPKIVVENPGDDVVDGDNGDNNDDGEIVDGGDNNDGNNNGDEGVDNGSGDDGVVDNPDKPDEVDGENNDGDNDAGDDELEDDDNAEGDEDESELENPSIKPGGSAGIVSDDPSITGNPDEIGDVDSNIVDPTEEPVAGSVNSAKTKKIGLGRRIINWIGRHWLLASIVTTAVTLTIGAVAGPLAPAAIAVARFASFNVGTFATIGAAALGVKYFTFRKRRQANSAQAHFLSREKKVQKHIKKSENYLTKISTYQKQVADLQETLKRTDLSKRDRRKLTKQVDELYSKMDELDQKNMKIIKGLNHEFDEVKLPKGINFVGRLKHTVQRVTGTATLGRLKSEMDPYIDKKIAKKPDSKNAEHLKEMKFDGNLVDEFFNYQIVKRKTQEGMKKRAELVKTTEPKGEKSAVYKRLKTHLDTLHAMSYTDKQQTGPVPLETQKTVGKVVKQIVTENPEVKATMQGVEQDKIIQYGTDPVTGKPAVVVTTPSDRREYGDNAAAKKFPPARTK